MAPLSDCAHGADSSNASSCEALRAAIRFRDDGLTRWRETHQMKKEYLVLTIILAISLIVTLVLLIGTPSFTCKAEGKCLDPMGLCWILADS